MKVAFQGVHGAYSELASKQLFGPRCQTVPCETFEDVFTAVEKGHADRGMIPIENSLAGSIHQNYDLLLTRNAHIVGEAHLKVEHVLMCHPSAAWKDLTQVRSHPQALAQCSGFFAKERQVKPVVYFDTAGAAKSLVSEAPADIGAIASEYAAELYGLKILRRNLQNQPNNFTRFLAIATGSASASADSASAAVGAAAGKTKKTSSNRNATPGASAQGIGSAAQGIRSVTRGNGPATQSISLATQRTGRATQGKGPSTRSNNDGIGPNGGKTSIAFMPAKNQVGILFRILGVFALRDIDLLKIESRPNPRSPFEYWFYADLDGVQGQPQVDKALDHLREMTAEVKILGSYPRAD